MPRVHKHCDDPSNGGIHLGLVLYKIDSAIPKEWHEESAGSQN